jgi:hypothetical protein
MEEQPTFFSHVFNFETESRNEMVNIIQYTVISIIFISILNKAIKQNLPQVDKDKGSIAIFVEVSIECIVLFLGMLFIHRIITFIPTMSGTKYADQNLITVILPTLVILLGFSTLGEKINILIERYSGNITEKIKTHAPTQSYLPTQPTVNPQSAPQPDFNNMFAGPTTPLVNASSPDSFEPVAANSMGSIF